MSLLRNFKIILKNILKIQSLILVLFVVFGFNSVAHAEAPSVTIAAACQQGVLPDGQCPEPVRACVHEPEASVDTVVERALGGRTAGEYVFGNETGQVRTTNGQLRQVDDCDHIGRIRAADVNTFVNNCDFVPQNRQYQDLADINSVAQLQLRDSMINSVFQDLAARSLTQITCRVSVFNNYITDTNNSRAVLHARARDKFNQVRERIQGLILSKQIAIQSARDRESRDNENCGAFAAVNGDSCISSIVSAGSVVNSQYEAAIAAEITKIPFGYEPDVATALFAMAQAGEFNEFDFFNAMELAKNKYIGLQGYYTNNDTPTGNGGTLYCISNSYKKFAVSTGIVEQLLNSYPPTTLSPQSREILQCKLNSKYRDTPNNIDTTFNTAFLVGGGIAAVLTAVPTGGGSLATYGAVAGIGLSTASFALQLQRAHEACRQRSFLVSPTGGELCRADQDFNNEVNQSSLSRCLAQSGLAALEAVPVLADVAVLMRGRNGVVRTADLLEEYNRPPIVVTAQRGNRNTENLTGGNRTTNSGGRRARRTSPRDRTDARRGTSEREASTTTTETSSARTLAPISSEQLASARWAFISRGTTARQTLSRTNMRPNPEAYDFIERVAPAGLRPVLHSARQKLQNSSLWGDYADQLIRDVGENMLASNIRSIRERALRGEITRNDVLRVLVQRARARGETFRTTRNAEDDDFYELVRSGPFFDRFFDSSPTIGNVRHGVDTHLIQRDMIAQNMTPEELAQFEEMFQFMGTGSGRDVWKSLFDSFIENSPTQPEALFRMLSPVIPLN